MGHNFQHGGRLRLLGGGVDHGVPDGCYANHHRVADGWQIIVHIIKEEGCKDAAKWDQGSLMGKLMETL